MNARALFSPRLCGTGWLEESDKRQLRGNTNILIRGRSNKSAFNKQIITSHSKSTGALTPQRQNRVQLVANPPESILASPTWVTNPIYNPDTGCVFMVVYQVLLINQRRCCLFENSSTTRQSECVLHDEGVGDDGELVVACVGFIRDRSMNLWWMGWDDLRLILEKNLKNNKLPL